MHTTPRGMANSVSSIIINGTSGASSTTAATGAAAEVEAAAPTLSEREQLRIEFYKTYDVMTGVRIAMTLGGFFSLMVLLVVYKSRCKSNRQLEDPRLTAAAEAAVAEAEAEERALAAALEALARQQPKPARGPRRSLCVDQIGDQMVMGPSLPLVAPRFASVGGGYDSLLAAPIRYSRSRLNPQRRCSSITCSSTASSYLERRGSAMVMPSLPPAPSYPRHHHHARAAYDEQSWDYYHPIDIQVIQPTPELSPCGSEAGLYGATAAVLRHQHQLRRVPGRRAPLASMGSVDPPDPDSLRSLGSDSVFACGPADTEDEVSGFSTDSSDGPVPCSSSPRSAAKRGSAARRNELLRLPGSGKRGGNGTKPAAAEARWDGCVGCVPRRRRRGSTPHRHTPQTACMTISASVDAPSRSPVLSTTTSSSQNSVGANGLGSPPAVGPYSATTSPIELRYRPQPQQQQQQPRPNSSPTAAAADWSQETLF